MEKVTFDGSQPTTAVGYYSYQVAQDVWTWSDGVYRLHGYAPREVPATTEVLLRHKHPDDRSRAAEVLDTAVQNGEPFSCYHRVIDRHEHVRSVLSVGRGIANPTGQVKTVEGYFVDLTDARRDETESEVRLALEGMAEHGETIDIAKGMLMLASSASCWGVARRRPSPAPVGGVGSPSDERGSAIPQPPLPSGVAVAPDSQRVDLEVPTFTHPTDVTNPLFPVSKQHAVVGRARRGPAVPHRGHPPARHPGHRVGWSTGRNAGLAVHRVPRRTHPGGGLRPVRTGRRRLGLVFRRGRRRHRERHDRHEGGHLAGRQRRPGTDDHARRPLCRRRLSNREHPRDRVRTGDREVRGHAAGRAARSSPRHGRGGAPRGRQHRTQAVRPRLR